MTQSRTVAALVVTYHTGPRLKECLYALRADPDVSEIVIVDNGNPDKDEKWLDAFAAASVQVNLLRDGTNLGFGAAVNAGARHSGADHLLIVNPDAVVKRGAIARLRAVLADMPAPAIVGGKIFNTKGVEQRGGRRNTLTLARALGLGTWTLESEPEPSGPISVGASIRRLLHDEAARFHAAWRV